MLGPSWRIGRTLCAGQPQVGWLSGLGIGKAQLSCCDAVKGTLFSAVAVEHAFGYSSAPLQGKSFRKAVSAVMDYSRAP